MDIPEKTQSPSFDRMVYLRLTEACNMSCEHCFIPSNPKRLRLDEDGSRTVQHIVSISKPNETVLIQFHGGEPTIVGPRELSDWCALISARITDRKIVFGIQTNLAIDPTPYLALYKKYMGASIGVSWDYAIRALKGDRAESFEVVFWRNIDVLRRNGIEVTLVTTVTKELISAYNSGFKLLEFLASKGIKYLHLERLTKVGSARENWPKIGVTNREHSLFMATLYLDYVKNISHGRGSINISPFDGLELSLVHSSGDTSGYGCNSGKCDTAFFTIDAEGLHGSCTALNSTADISDHIVKIVDISGSLQNARVERVIDCSDCRYRKICSSGCFATDVNDGSGECSGSRILYGTIERKIMEASHYESR